ncbi:MAG: hypothetical protein U0353_13285 [Sandaracinus sp.]
MEWNTTETGQFNGVTVKRKRRSGERLEAYIGGEHTGTEMSEALIRQGLPELEGIEFDPEKHRFERELIEDSLTAQRDRHRRELLQYSTHLRPGVGPCRARIVILRLVRGRFTRMRAEHFEDFAAGRRRITPDETGHLRAVRVDVCTDRTQSWAIAIMAVRLRVGADRHITPAHAADAYAKEVTAGLTGAAALEARRNELVAWTLTKKESSGLTTAIHGTFGHVEVVDMQRIRVEGARP